ncbi:tetratricopeptide repeat protein [Simkania negevensis]|uniref:Lipoprotein n=1 Tax=Simkania negevensis (strain ATCC VR-1471 / DSM 27360 / Z) TaxID=331113 RepID=F8L3N2_SIMNZ|nr:hypothetical protein [Simkania negevensis]CCB89891.1 putative uncharacterized protein [Simkania negevensis Z]
MKSKLLLLLLVVFVSSCYKVSDKLEPQVNYAVQDRYLKQLPPAFPELSYEEKKEAWGKEYILGQRFAQDLDFYRAITTFKRSEYLLPEEDTERLLEIQYQMLLCYYLGKRYQDAIQTYNHSKLYTTTIAFPAYHDMLVILYECYIETGDQLKAEHTLRTIRSYYPETAKKLELATILIEGDLIALEKESQQSPSQTYLSEILTEYDAKKKSVKKAQTFNMILPGAGYLYVGQKQSAVTAFLLNGLFIAAAVHFFCKGEIAAGVITTSFEAGWYFGGIYGAGESAKLYNERVYEDLAYPALNRNGLFPVLMLQYGF